MHGQSSTCGILRPGLGAHTTAQLPPSPGCFWTGGSLLGRFVPRSPHSVFPSISFPPPAVGISGLRNSALQRAMVGGLDGCRQGVRAARAHFLGSGSTPSGVGYTGFSPRATELFGSIQAAAVSTTSSQSLAGLLIAVVDSAYLELQQDEADAVASIAALAVGSAEHWEENLAPMINEVQPWVSENCGTLTVEECLGDYTDGGCGPPDCWETKWVAPSRPSPTLVFQTANWQAEPVVKATSGSFGLLAFTPQSGSCDHHLPSTSDMLLEDLEVAIQAAVGAAVAGA